MIKDLVQLMLSYTATKCEIATLQAKNQNAPKYLHMQAGDMLVEIAELADEIDKEIDLIRRVAAQ